MTEAEKQFILMLLGETDLQLINDPVLSRDILPFLIRKLSNSGKSNVQAAASNALAKTCSNLGIDRAGIFKNHIFLPLTELYKTKRMPAVLALKATGQALPDKHPFKKLMLNIYYRSADPDSGYKPEEMERGILSLDDLFKIYSNDAFLHFTKDMHPVNQFSVARVIDTTLKRFGKAVTHGKITLLSAFIMRKVLNDNFLEKVFLDKNSSVIIGVNDDRALFLPQDVEEFIQRFIDASDKESYDKQVHGPYVGTFNDRKNTLRGKFRNTLGKTFAYLYGHGGPNHFWLHGGEEGEGKSNNLEHPDGISYQELKLDLIARAKKNKGILSDLTIFFDCCFSGSNITNIYNALGDVYNFLEDAVKRGDIKDLPDMVASSSKGTFSFSLSLDGFTRENIMLKGLKEVTQGVREFKGKHVIKAETLKYVVEAQDISIFVNLTKEQQKELFNILGVEPSEEGKTRYFSFGEINSPLTTENYLDERLPVLSGLMGKKVNMEIVADTATNIKELHIYDKQHNLLGTRNLRKIEKSQQKLSAAIERLKTAVNPQYSKILDAFLGLLEHSPPDFYTFSDPIEDSFGTPSDVHNLIALAEDLLSNDMAVYHEIEEYYKIKGSLKLSFDDKSKILTIILNGKTFTFTLGGKSLVIARKWIKEGAQFKTHYWLRAAQYEMFKDSDVDVKLTRKIKQIQIDAKAKPAQDERKSNPEEVRGGIDLNPNKLKVERRGSGIKINLPEDIEIIPQAPIIGLTPVIIQIKPVYDLPLLLRMI